MKRGMATTGHKHLGRGALVPLFLYPNDPNPQSPHLYPIH